MISEISAIVTTIQGLRDINRGLQEIKTLDAVREKAVEMNFLIMDLQNAVMSVQALNQSLSKENEQLQKQLDEVESWEDVTRNDRLYELAAGVLVYVREDAFFPETKEPVYLCPNCYHNRKSSFLHRGLQNVSGIQFKCPLCDNTYLDHSRPSKRPTSGSF